jgi:alkylation response protein AidB-like acyl-CoA dehydrogenase
MDRYFDDNHEMIREMVRDFARSEIAPVAEELDERSEFPWDNVRKMGELGLLGAPWDEDMGGAGMDYTGYLLVIEELAKVDASHAITVSAHTTLGTSRSSASAPTASGSGSSRCSLPARSWAGSASPSRAPALTPAARRRPRRRRMEAGC